ncbi:MAG: hypothetical protein ACKO2Z_18210, partial [Sphaerospermopsis kisseleviana]
MGLQEKTGVGTGVGVGVGGGGEECDRTPATSVVDQTFRRINKIDPQQQKRDEFKHQHEHNHNHV